MRNAVTCTVTACLVGGAVLVHAWGDARVDARPVTASAAPQAIDLTALLSVGRLRGVNRQVSAAPGRPGAVHVSAADGPGVVWLVGTEGFSDGTIEVAILGRDIFQQSFPGIAFHRQDDARYEAVYLRPFNFRATDPDRHVHALQYVSVPDFDWPKLRQDHPNQYESAVAPDVAPTDWVPLRIVVSHGHVQAYVGGVTSPTLDIEALGGLKQGGIGLWVGNNSDGDFADLKLTVGELTKIAALAVPARATP